jgi:dipeptidyl aminopeptidase/acylaminoacyl peptidase
MWIGNEEYGGLPTPARRGSALPPHWRLEAVTATERPRSISLGRDGRTLVYVHDRETSDVWVLDLADGAARRLTTGRDPMPYWEDMTPVLSPDGGTVAYVDEGAVWLVSVAGGVARRVTEFQGMPTRWGLEAGSPVWLDDGRLLVSVDRDDRNRLAVAEVEDAWATSLVRSSPELDSFGDEEHPSVSPDGKLVAFPFVPRADLNRTEIRVVDVATGQARALTGAEATKDRECVWAPDGRSLAFTAQRGEWSDLMLVDVGTGEERVLAAAEADFWEPCWSPDGMRVAVILAAAGRSDLVAFDVASGEVTQLAAGGLWGTPLWTATGAVVATYEDHATAPQLRRVQPDGSVEILVDPAPSSVRVAPHVLPEEVTFRSSDGLEIQAFLYRPSGASAENPAAAVVYPHGGPTESYGDEWDGHAQYFVDKGYAWLAPNYRGSTGRGKTFERLNFGDWGVGDVQDCLAAADFLQTIEWVDGKRLGIFGASYGSYLALGSAVEDAGERFRCAVCKYGDCDLLTTWSQGDREGVLYCGENMLGRPSRNRDVYLRGSPVHRLDRLEVPLLIAHGELDARVHPKQSEELVAELRRLGKTFEYVTYPTEAHGFLRAGPQLDFYRRLERFLDWYLL